MTRPTVALACALLSICAAPMMASIVATYEPAGVQWPDQTALCAGTSTCVVGTETFDSWYGGGFSFTTAPNPAGEITMSYSGGFQSYGADEYGGAAGTGRYPEIFSSGGSYTLNLSASGTLPGVNYFGLWFSALDAGNLLQFYNGSTLVYSFTPADFITLVGACDGSNPFCGNPNNPGEDSGEQFAFLNFFDTDGYVTAIVFSESGGGGFESDNHTAGYLDPIHSSGTLIYTPEPGSFGLLLIAAAAMAFRFRRRRSW